VFLVRKGLDWDKVCDVALKHRVFPLVFRHVEHFEPGLIPSRVLRLFGMLFLANGAKSETLAKQLAGIMDAFHKAGIAAVPFKGPLLGHLIWGDHRLWVGGDLDLLVRPRDLGRAVEVLSSEGYRSVGRPERERPLQRPLMPWRPLVQLAKQNATLTAYVDLQTSIFPWWMSRRGLDEQVWRDVRSGDVFGSPGMLLPYSWNLILLSLHAYKHLFVLLRWASELYELWNRAGTRRDTILAKSEQIGMKREVLFSIAVCEHLLGKDSTERSGVNNVLVRRIARGVFRKPRSPLSAELLRLQLPGSAIRKVYKFTTDVFAPVAVEGRLLRLPRWLHFVYYLIRPVSRAFKYVRRQPLARGDGL